MVEQAYYDVAVKLAEQQQAEIGRLQMDFDDLTVQYDTLLDWARAAFYYLWSVSSTISLVQVAPDVVKRRASDGVE